MVIQLDGSHVLQIWKRNHDIDPNTSAEVLHRETIGNLRAGERWHEAYQAVFHQDMPALLAQVRCPILLLCGPGDLLFPYFPAAARARMPRRSRSTRAPTCWTMIPRGWRQRSARFSRSQGPPRAAAENSPPAAHV